MLIKNLTSKRQTLVVKELTGDHREYDICIESGKSTDLDHSLVVANPEEYQGIFEFGCCGKCHPVEEKKVEVKPVVEEVAPIVEETIVQVEETVVAESEPVKDPEGFICDICGAEFASAKGLSAHKNKAHASK